MKYSHLFIFLGFGLLLFVLLSLSLVCLTLLTGKSVDAVTLTLVLTVYGTLFRCAVAAVQAMNTYSWVDVALALVRVLPKFKK